MWDSVPSGATWTPGPVLKRTAGRRRDHAIDALDCGLGVDPKTAVARMSVPV